MSQAKFGWIPPTDQRKILNSRYPFKLLGWTAPAVVNTELPIPDLWDFYDQGNTPRCVAYSSQFMESINAFQRQAFDPAIAIQEWLHIEATKASSGTIVRYDPSWLWKQIGGTSQGAYIEDALDVLRKGNLIWTTSTPSLEEGIKNYVHTETAEDHRIGVANGAGGLLGIPWHRAWLEVTSDKNGIAKLDDNPKSWGRIEGYHSIDWNGWYDKYDGVRINNSWGKAWNKGAKVILTRKAIDYMLTYERAEGYVVTDFRVDPIPPPPPTDKKKVILYWGDEPDPYIGELTRTQQRG